MKKPRAALRVFQLMRDEDVSGVSGVGRVAVGVVFPSGKVLLEWLGSDTTFGIYDKLDHVERIHGHGDKTRMDLGEPAHLSSACVRMTPRRSGLSHACT
jgi:hypothetical protein